MLHIVMPLANDVDDEWTEVGPNFKVRADAALVVARESYAAGNSVLVAQAAGRPKQYTGRPTISVLGARYIESQWPECELLINKDDVNIWGTMPEIKWIIEQILEHYSDRSVKLTLVTQKRHMHRVRFIVQQMLKPPAWIQIEYEPSGQTKEISMPVELFKYLVVVYAHYFPASYEWIRTRVRLKFDKA